MTDAWNCLSASLTLQYSAQQGRQEVWPHPGSTSTVSSVSVQARQAAPARFPRTRCSAVTSCPAGWADPHRK